MSDYKLFTYLKIQLDINFVSVYLFISFNQCSYKVVGHIIKDVVSYFYYFYLNISFYRTAKVYKVFPFIKIYTHND